MPGVSATTAALAGAGVGTSRVDALDGVISARSYPSKRSLTRQRHVRGSLRAPAAVYDQGRLGPTDGEGSMTQFDVERLRRRFPALSIEDGGRPVALFDGPGGTQVPDTVIDAIETYYRTSNANHGGA